MLFRTPMLYSALVTARSRYLWVPEKAGLETKFWLIGLLDGIHEAKGGNPLHSLKASPGSWSGAECGLT